MSKSVLMFVLGFLAASVLLAVLLWVGRENLVRLLSFDYQYKNHQVVLLKDFRLYQRGVEVGHLKSGTQLRLDGYDKTSPIENFSITLGWENRGSESKNLFKERADKAVFTELVPVEDRR